MKNATTKTNTASNFHDSMSTVGLPTFAGKLLADLEQHQRQHRMNIRNFFLAATNGELKTEIRRAHANGEHFFADCVRELYYND